MADRQSETTVCIVVFDREPEELVTEIRLTPWLSRGYAALWLKLAIGVSAIGLYMSVYGWTVNHG